MKTRKEFVEEVVANFRAGMPCKVIMQKSYDDKMYKAEGGSRKKDAPKNPYIGRVEVEETWSGYCVGVDYASAVAGAAVRSGNTEVTKNDIALKESWHKPLEGFEGWFSTDKATESKTYINLNYNAKQVAKKVSVRYFLDGRVATDAEVADISKWAKPVKEQSMSSTQVENGVDDANRQFFILINVDNIVSICQGSRCVSIED